MRAVALALLLLATFPAVAEEAVVPRWAIAVFPSGAEFSLEIAADPRSRARGYMYREHVGPEAGMLFLFESSGRHSIWMKNCKVALDLIWLDERFGVVEIARDRQPCVPGKKCPSHVPLQSARYVLEVAAGRSDAEGLAVGDRLVILSEPALP